MFRTVLVPVDGSKNAEAAIKTAAEVAARFDAQLILLHVMRHRGSDQVLAGMEELERIEHIKVTEAAMLRDVANAIVSEARELAEKSGAVNPRGAIDDGDPASQIIEYCKSNQVDLIVMGRRGLGTLTGLIMGSVSQKVSHLAPCACMIVPDGQPS